MAKALIAVDKSRMYRVYLTITTDMVEEARKIHQTTPLATAALGRVLTGAGLMGIMLKNEKDKLTLSFKGDGPAQQILATSYANGNVKGYIANPNVDLPPTEHGKLDVGGALGIGELKVIKDLGMREPYMGSIALVTGEIADDLTAYFFISEQQNTSVALGVKIEHEDLSVHCAGGMIIQMLPGFEDAAVDALEEMLKDLKPLTTLIDEVMAVSAGKTEEAILNELLYHIFKDMPAEFTPEVFGYKDIQWQCDCSEERIEKALMTIGREDLTEIIEEDGQTEMVCQFCETKYHFDKEHLERLLEQM